TTATEATPPEPPRPPVAVVVIVVPPVPPVPPLPAMLVVVPVPPEPPPVPPVPPVCIGPVVSPPLPEIEPPLLVGFELAELPALNVAAGRSHAAIDALAATKTQKKAERFTAIIVRRSPGAAREFVGARGPAAAGNRALQAEQLVHVRLVGGRERVL